MRKFIPLIAALSLSGCASLTTPSADKIASLPTIEAGQKAPPGHEYILHIPAGKPEPFTLLVAGDSLVAPGEATTMVTAKQDVYLYKKWASLDGKHWQPSHALFKVQINAGIAPEGGKVEIKFDLAKQ